MQFRALLCLICLVFASRVTHGATINLALEPLLTPSIFQAELAPLFNYLDERYSLEYKPSYDIAGYVQQIHAGEINAAFTVSPYLDEFKKHDFDILLINKNIVNIGLVTKKTPPKKAVKKNKKKARIVYSKNDLLSKQHAEKWKGMLDYDVETYHMMDDVILSILSNEYEFGVIAMPELGLLPDNVRDQLKVVYRSEGSYLYFVAHKSLRKYHSQIQADIIGFFENFKGPKDKYYYLNKYRFKEYQK